MFQNTRVVRGLPRRREARNLLRATTLLATRAFVLSLALALSAGCAANRARESDAPATHREATAVERIDFYTAALEENPRHYAALTQLGVALLDLARETHDPALLARARRAEEESLAIQPSYEALFAMAQIQNFSHRFEDAIRWGRRAAAASVGGSRAPDAAVVAALVEAHLGFGQIAEARRLLPSSAEAAGDFHTSVSVARVLSEESRPLEAAAAMSRASKQATKDGADDLAAWAETAAAGVLLDSGHSDAARPHLEAAQRLAAPTPFLRLHHAELAMTTGDATTALAILEELLLVDPDPAIEALAADAAGKAGADEAAERHFAAAEKGFLRAVDANEVYTLGSLARLYLAAGRNLGESERLARRNLEWKRDREARELVAAVESKIRGASRKRR